MNIVTLTMCAVLEKSTTAKFIAPGKKILCRQPAFKPGGGGINVSRAMKRLGVDSTACFMADESNAQLMMDFFDAESIKYILLSSDKPPVERLVIKDETTKQQYIFDIPLEKIGKEFSEKALKLIGNVLSEADYIVVSGGLPPGVPSDFYAHVASVANKQNVKMILDTSGKPLLKAFEQKLYMIKTNLNEIASAVGKKILTGMELENVVIKLLKEKKCEIIVVSMSSKGAMMAVEGDDIEYIVPPVVDEVSPAGAGDSMTAGIMAGFSKGWSPPQAVRYGVAAGTAATMKPGSELCNKEDTDKIFAWLSPPIV